MASTRNRNTPGDYELEQISLQKGYDYFSSESVGFFGTPAESYFPGNGLIGMVTAHSNLSQNYCDIESQLRGIGSTNLVTPQPEISPMIYSMSSLNIFKKPEVQHIVPPNPTANQRPMVLN